MVRLIGNFDIAEEVVQDSLVAALETRGLRVARAGPRPVITSARPDARAAGGFGDLLTTLGGG